MNLSPSVRTMTVMHGRLSGPCVVIMDIVNGEYRADKHHWDNTAESDRWFLTVYSIYNLYNVAGNDGWFLLLYNMSCRKPGEIKQ